MRCRCSRLRTAKHWLNRERDVSRTALTWLVGAVPQKLGKRPNIFTKAQHWKVRFRTYGSPLSRGSREQELGLSSKAKPLDTFQPRLQPVIHFMGALKKRRDQ